MQYIKELASQSVLAPKFQDINELLLAVHHLRIYDGCEYGCPYCDAWTYSNKPINEKITISVNLPERLRKELKVVLSSDIVGLDFGEPYQPVEQEYRITRKALEILNSVKQPYVILTKSPGVLEDITLLQEINKDSFAIVIVTLPSVEESMVKLLEPDAPPVNTRINIITELEKAGVPCGFALMPIIPFLTDGEDFLKNIIDVMSQANPDFILWGPLWIPNIEHRKRIEFLLGDYISEIKTKYNELYGNNHSPKDLYLQSLNKILLKLCKHYNLEPRIPSKIYSKHLPKEIVEELESRNEKFINSIYN